MKYSIDSSALINGWQKYYPPDIDIFSPIWDGLSSLIDSGDLRATEEVLHELEKQHDDVYQWVNERPNLFIPIDDRVQNAVIDILRGYPRLVDNRKDRSSADPFVIAQAQISGAIVVADEFPSNNILKPKIPDVCVALGINCITLLQLIRREGWTSSS